MHVTCSLAQILETSHVGIHTMTFEYCAALLEGLSDILVVCQQHINDLHDDIFGASRERGHDRRICIRRATIRIQALQRRLEIARVRQAEILEELILIRYHHANVGEIGRVFTMFRALAAFRHRPVVSVRSELVWPQHPYENLTCESGDADNLDGQASFAYWHRDMNGGWHVVRVQRTPYPA